MGISIHYTILKYCIVVSAFTNNSALVWKLYY